MHSDSKESRLIDTSPFDNIEKGKSLMQDYKIVFCDIDGTLVDSRRQPIPENLEAVREIVSKGIIFVLCSGRIFGGQKYLHRDIGITGPIVCFSGGQVFFDDKVIINHTISTESARKIHKIADEWGMESYVYIADKWYVDKHTDWYDYEFRVVHVKGNIEPIDVLLDKVGRGDLPHVNKILVMDHDYEKVKRFEKLVNTEFSDELDAFRSENQFVEVMPKGINKGVALKEVCAHFNIPVEQSVAVGDYYNDRSMLLAAGLGIAMGNAPEDLRNEVLEHGGYVTDTNDNAGLAKALRKFIH